MEMARIQIRIEHQALAGIQICISVPKWREFKSEFRVDYVVSYGLLFLSKGRADAECQRFSLRDQTKE